MVVLAPGLMVPLVTSNLPPLSRLMVLEETLATVGPPQSAFALITKEAPSTRMSPVKVLPVFVKSTVPAPRMVREGLAAGVT